MLDEKALDAAFEQTPLSECPNKRSFRKIIERYESAGQQLSVPTEAMCDQARGFIMGIDLGCRTWGAMQRHLNMGGYPSLPRIHEMAETDPKGHITKWDVAECIFMLMTQPAVATAGATYTKDV